MNGPFVRTKALLHSFRRFSAVVSMSSVIAGFFLVMTVSTACSDDAKKTISDEDGGVVEPECEDKADCPEDFDCVENFCYLECGDHSDCPDGYFCDPVHEECMEKMCETNADCTDETLTECDSEFFECREPLPQVAPDIVGFRASPPAVVAGSPAPVTWVWEFETPPSPAPVCTINENVGEVERNGVAELEQMLPGVTTYELTCTNTAGSSSAQVTIPALLPARTTIQVTPSGGAFDFAGARLVIPEDSVVEQVDITAELTNEFTPSPNLATLPVKFEPEGLRFTQMVSLTLSVATDVMEAAGWNVSLEELRIVTTGEDSAEEDDWQVRVFTETNTAESTLTAEISHFSAFAASNTTKASCSSPPLSVLKKTVVRRDEFMWMGSVDWDEYDVFGQVHDDLKQTDRDRMADIFDSLGTDKRDGTLEKAVTGDFNGDGRDQIAVATRFRKDDGKYAVQLTILSSCSGEPENCWNDIQPEEKLIFDDWDVGTVDLAVGDLDGDGRDEIVLATSSRWVGNIQVYEYNPDLLMYRIVAQEFMTDTADLKVAVGNMYRHRPGSKANRDYIALAYTMRNQGKHYIWRTDILRYEPPSFDLTLVTHVRGTATSNYSRPGVAFADVSNNGHDELVVVPIKRGGQRIYFHVFEMKEEEGSLTKPYNAFKWDLETKFRWHNHDSPEVVATDMNGNGAAEIWVSKGVDCRFNCSIQEQMGFTLLMHTALGPQEGGSRVLSTESLNYGTHGGLAMAVGDIDADGREDLFIAFRPLGSKYDMRIYSMNAQTSEVEVMKQWTPNVGSRNLKPIVAVGDIDGDNLTVRYTGECWYTQTDPRPLVVLAAPPVDVDLEQFREESETMYGTTTTTTHTEGNSVSNSSGTTLSFTQDFLGGLFETSASRTLSHEFTKTETNTQSTAYGTHYAAPWREDNPRNYMIYTTTEYTSYEFEIVSSPEPEALLEENKYMTIDVPQSTDTLAVTVGFYNSMVEESRRIGDETLTHTLGDPWSYKTITECDDIANSGAGWLSPGGMTVGQDVATTASIAMESVQASATERTMSVEQEVGASIAGVGFSKSQGYSESSVYEVSIGESTEYSGTVGGIDSLMGNQYYLDNRYKYWLLVHKINRNDGTLKYTVVDYCIE